MNEKNQRTKKRQILAQLPACRLTLSVSLRSGPVTAVKFGGQNVLASSSGDGSTKFWDLETGQETAEAVPEGFTFPKEGCAQKKSVNDLVVAAQGKTLRIFKVLDGNAETAHNAPVAFFQCDSEIKTFDVADLERSNMASNVASNLAVGCADGQVLQLWAAVLQTQV